MGNRKKFIVCLFSAVCFVFCLAGCGKSKDESVYHVEYLNKEKTKLVKVPYEPVASDTGALIAELLGVLAKESENVEYSRPIPSGVEIISYSLDDVLLTIRFNTEYAKLDPVQEVLCRAAIVRTMTQLAAVDCVSFYIGDIPLADADGDIIGTMNSESFIENPGEQINSIQNTALTLYFANESGDALVKEVRDDVYYSSNISLEKLVMEQLLEGPHKDGEKSALPSGTRLVTVSVADGVCYVNLDETFKNQDYKINEAIVIYSIVNSLTELTSISKVQISINGDTGGVYRDTFKLSNMYERNLDYVVSDTK